MTREMLLEKSLSDLREIAKVMGIPSVTKYRKNDLADLIIAQGVKAEEEKTPAEQEKPAEQIMPAEQNMPAEEAPRDAAKRSKKKETKTAEAGAQDVDYSPRRKGRPRKAMNDPTPLGPEDAAVPESAEGGKPVSQEEPPQGNPAKGNPAQENPPQEKPAPQEKPQQEDKRFQQRQSYGRNDFRQQNRQYNQNRYQQRDYQQNRDYQPGRDYQNRDYQQRDFQQNRDYQQRDYQQRDYQQRDFQQNRDYQQGWQNGYQPQGWPGRDIQQDYPPRMGYPQFDDPRFRQGGYYNAEYGTSNPAVPEMLEGGECGDAEGILEIVSEGYGFLRCENYLPSPRDVYISSAQIRRFRLKNGDKVTGKTRPTRDTDKYNALLYITAVNDMPPEEALNRRSFEELVPIFPNERLTLEFDAAKQGERLAIRLIDLMAPIGKGQRGLIVSQPKAGKTTLLKNIANGITNNFPDVTLIVLLIDERPEEVTDMQRSINGEVVYSTFDQLPENHTRLAELVQERAMRLVEQGKDVVILLDSITRLARAYNLTITPSGRTLSGGMDPAALYKPKRFFGAARNIENGGSLTVIATALVETGSRMDDMVYEEFKGTGNMEIHLDRKLSERRIFPAVDIYKSGTRRDELLLSPEETECATMLRRMLVTGNAPEVTEQVIDMLNKSETNEEFIASVKRLATGYESKGYTAGKAFTRHY